MTNTLLQDIVALAKRRGFVYPGSEIYGGLANTWDYGPLGVELKRNIKNLWWDEFITKREDMVGLDSSIILNTKVWEASGHLAGFSDAMVDCKNCHSRTRADHLIEDYFEVKKNEEIKVEGKTPDELTKIIKDNNIQCVVCGSKDLTKVRDFSLLFSTQMGILKDDSNTVYLRGETAQGIFVDFKNIIGSTRTKIPFGVGQIGKSFRNEITKGQFVFRTVEFEQAEIEYFFNPAEQEWEQLYDKWLDRMQDFVIDTLGVDKNNLRIREHSDDERSFYSKKTVDLEYNFPFGFKELWGLAYRTNYDLKQHQESSGKDLTYTDPHTGNKFLPHVIEPALGINRLFLTILCDAYYKDVKNNRTVLKLAPNLAPNTLAVFPLLKNNESLVLKARRLYDNLSDSYRTTWDERGNIGKRYFYQDEAGTPFCLTVDHQSLDDDTVTIRDRDTTSQERVNIAKLNQYIDKKLAK